MSNADTEMRFGIVAVDKGFITADQVIKALEIQVKENISLGMHRRIGMILFEQGHLTLSQINEVIEELESNGIRS